jgi:multidrug efflux pump subunit AcrA (membrane-fusion protein)
MMMASKRRMELQEQRRVTAGSTLARLEAAGRLVNDVDAALAAHESIVAVARAQRFQRIADFHWYSVWVELTSARSLGRRSNQFVRPDAPKTSRNQEFSSRPALLNMLTLCDRLAIATARAATHHDAV